MPRPPWTPRRSRRSRPAARASAELRPKICARRRTADSRASTDTGAATCYPHDYDDADVDQQYLPDELGVRVFYEPSEEGMELKIGERLQRLRRRRLEGRRGPG